MADITMCTNQECLKKEKCYRQTCEPSEYMQSFQKFIPKDNIKYGFECEYFIKNTIK